MVHYTGHCHCGAIQFSFTSKPIETGVRCNCSLCTRKGALMSAFTLKPEQLNIEDAQQQLAVYEFGSGVAQHYFCKTCGIYPFHQTKSTPGEYRINLGCIDHLDLDLTQFQQVDGASF